MSGRIQYIKIARIDKNGTDNTTALETLSTLVLPSGSNFTEYKILSKTRYRNYFLYYVQPPDRNNIPNEITSSLNYNFTGSLAGSIVSFGTGIKKVAIVPMVSSEGTHANFYNPNNDRVEFNTLSQKNIHVKAIFTASIESRNGSIELYQADPTLTNITQLTTPVTLLIGTRRGIREASIPKANIKPGDVFFLGVNNQANNAPYITASFSDTTLNITSSAATGDALQTIIEPNFTSKFFNEDCDVLQNNATRGIPNNLLQKVDYSTDAMNPVNFEALISGTAETVDIPQSHFEISSILNPTYNKSIVQSDDVNLFRYYRTPKLTDFGNPINIGNIGQTPSVSSLDTTIYEFEWGGSTAPLILGYGAVKMGRLLSVSSPEQISTINPSDGLRDELITVSHIPSSEWANYGLTGSFSQSRGNYYEVLNGNNPVNNRISMYQYGTTAGTNPVLPNTTKIATTEFGVPLLPNFMATSSQGSTSGTYGNLLTGNFFTLKHNQPLSIVKEGYVPGATIPITSSSPTGSSVANSILPSLNKGERWFVTFYRNFEVGFENQNLNPYIPTVYSQTDSNGNFVNALASRGVYEIKGIKENTGTGRANFYVYPPIEEFASIGGGEDHFLGFLMWKARAAGKNEFVIVQDEVSGGVSNGAFTSEFVPDYITENFEEITKEYGSNQTG